LNDEVVVDDELSTSDVLPSICITPTKVADGELPEAALKFAMAAARTYPASDGKKGHRKIISADSVMDPFAAEFEALEAQSKEGEQREEQEEHREVRQLLDLPDAALLAMASDRSLLAETQLLGTTCRRLSLLLQHETKQGSALLERVGCSSVASLHEATALFCMAHELTDDDLSLLVSLLDRSPAPRLHALYLNENALTDRGLDALAGSRTLQRLHHLSLANNRITDVGAMRLLVALAPGAALSGLHEINLRGNPLSDAARAEVRARHHQNKMYVAL